MSVAAKRATVKMLTAITVYRVDNFEGLEVNQEKSDESIRSWCILYTVLCVAHMLREADLRSSFERYHSLEHVSACDNYGDQVRWLRLAGGGLRGKNDATIEDIAHNCA